MAYKNMKKKGGGWGTRTRVENHCTYSTVELAISLPSNSELQTYDKLPCGYRRQQASLAYSCGTFVSHSMTQFHRAFPSPYFSSCLFHFLSVLHLPPCSFWCSDCYFSLIVSSEPCSLPLKWQLFTYLRSISKPYKGWPPITSHSSSAFSFAHTKANHFQEGIARGLCHRLHIFRVLWTPQQKKVDCNAVVPASCININACPFPPTWQAACQSMPHLLTTHNASTLLTPIHLIVANTRVHQCKPFSVLATTFL